MKGGEKKPEGVRPGWALAWGLSAWILALGGSWVLASPAGGLRRCLVLGVAAAGAVALGVFVWKYHSLDRSGTHFLAALAGGFLLNLFFLAGGTILARYSPLLGSPEGFALGYLGTALVCGGTYTWFLRKGRKAPLPSPPGRRETEETRNTLRGGRE